MIDVVDLMNRLRIAYTVRGQKLIANCPSPDHADRTARWAMFTEPGSRHGMHKCLSCGFGGGPVKLVMAHLALERGAALEFLQSSDQGAPVMLDVRLEAREARRTDVKVPEDVMFAALEDWDVRFSAYLLERGVTAEQVERWGVGYIDETTERHALRRRIWIPVRDCFGGLCNWQARTIQKNAQPKYLTASSVDGADAGAFIGEAFWPPPEERDELVIVEGPFDALAIDRLGRPVGGLRGSDVSASQAQKLSTWRRILVATDPDAAGYKASAMLNGLRRHLEIVPVALPKGEDVADLCVRSPSELTRILDAAAFPRD